MQKFIMMVGVAGSGKSTFARDLVDTLKDEHSVAYISSDGIREEVWGDESIQGNPAHIFAIAKARIFNELARGSDVVFDATNIRRAHRLEFIRRIKEINPEIGLECIFIDKSLETCLTQNKNRARVVPESVIEHQFKILDKPIYEEGWDSITHIIDESPNS